LVVNKNIINQAVTFLFLEIFFLGTVMITHLRIDDTICGQRVDNFLITHCKGVPKSRLYRAIRLGEVRVNKKRIKPSYRLCLQDDVRIPPFTLNAQTKKKSTRYHFLLDHIAYEDDNWILMNKPSGIPVHGGSSVHLGIIEALTQLRNDLRYLRLAHRLDRETSGCLLLAKKRAALLAFQALMLKRQIKKQYLVLVKGNFLGKKRTIDLPLRKNHLSSGERVVKVDASGKSAKTVFTLKKRFSTTTLLTATIITGRTHQIRVHAKAMGHPIAGDEKYGDCQFNKIMTSFGLNRLFLHAHRLSFKLKGQLFQFTVPMPLELEKVLKQIN
jgi:23S rRNA pseudouridine955/2504/2580 synthase